MKGNTTNQGTRNTFAPHLTVFILKDVILEAGAAAAESGAGEQCGDLLVPRAQPGRHSETRSPSWAISWRSRGEQRQKPPVTGRVTLSPSSWV